MPGAWEILGEMQPNIWVGILTREVVSTAWANGYRNLQLPPNSAVAFYAGMPFDHARNNAVGDAVRHNCRFLAFLDDDVIPPHDIFLRLMAHNLDIVSALYYRRHEGLQPCMQAVGGGWITDVPFGKLVEVGVVGAGALLVRRNVLEAMGPKWFEWRCDREDLPENQRLSEDFAACSKAREKGFRVVVDTGIVCKHVGFGAATPTGFAPMRIA